jgi:hypothetical protein
VNKENGRIKEKERIKGKKGKGAKKYGKKK